MRPMVAQVELLVPVSRRVHNLWQIVAAAKAHGWKQVDERVDQLRRQQAAMVPAVALLPASLAPELASQLSLGH